MNTTDIFELVAKFRKAKIHIANMVVCPFDGADEPTLNICLLGFKGQEYFVCLHENRPFGFVKVHDFKVHFDYLSVTDDGVLLFSNNGVRVAELQIRQFDS